MTNIVSGCVQTARPVLYDAQMVNSMIADIERIDLPCIDSQPFCKDGVSDLELNAECEFRLFVVVGAHCYFQYIGSVIWNSLPVSFRQSSSLFSFKSKQKAHFLSSA